MLFQFFIYKVSVKMMVVDFFCLFLYVLSLFPEVAVTFSNSSCICQRRKV